jgi:hypothetical protein
MMRNQGKSQPIIVDAVCGVSAMAGNHGKYEAAKLLISGSTVRARVRPPSK